MIGAPDIKHELGASYAGTSLSLLSAPLLLGVVLEPPLVLWMERWPRRWALVATLIAGGLCALATAAATTPLLFAIGFGAWAVTAGVGGALAEALLVQGESEPERALSRVGLMGMLGDAAAPLLMASTLALGGSWRVALSLVSLVYGAHALLVAFAPLDARAVDAEQDDEANESLIAAVRAAGGKPWLWAWLLAAALCSLLDETLVAFGSLFLRDELGASPELQGSAFAAFAVGGAVGLVIGDRLLARIAPLRVLLISAACCLIAYAAWLTVRSMPLSIALLFVLGATTALLHPIALARAYAEHTCRPTLVAAMSQLFFPIEVATPLVLGVIADRFGISTALCLLAVQPIALAALAWSALAKG